MGVQIPIGPVIYSWDKVYVTEEERLSRVLRTTLRTEASIFALLQPKTVSLESFTSNGFHLNNEINFNRLKVEA